jgi:hypothetical protein
MLYTLHVIQYMLLVQLLRVFNLNRPALVPTLQLLRVCNLNRPALVPTLHLLRVCNLNRPALIKTSGAGTCNVRYLTYGEYIHIY